MASIRTVAGALSALFLAGTAGAGAPEHVDNFALLDQKGKYHDLYYLSDMKAVVLMTHENECDAVGEALPALEPAKAAYAGEGCRVPDAERRRHAHGDCGRSPAQHPGAGRRATPGQRIAAAQARRPKCWSSTRRVGRSRTGDRSQRRKDDLLTSALDSVLAGQPVKKAKVVGQGLLDQGREDGRAWQARLLLERDRPDPARQLRRPATAQAASARSR